MLERQLTTLALTQTPPTRGDDGVIRPEHEDCLHVEVLEFTADQRTEISQILQVWVPKLHMMAHTEVHHDSALQQRADAVSAGTGR